MPIPRFLWLLLALGGCAALGSREGDHRTLEQVEPGRAALLVDRAEYHARYLQGDSTSVADWRQYGFRILARFVNRREVPVCIERCSSRDESPIYGVRYAGPDSLTGPLGTRTASAYDVAWACVGHDHPIVVPPGTVRTDVLEVSGPNTWETYGARMGREEGPFQLHYLAGECSAEPGRLLPERERTSPVFVVRSDHRAG